MMIVRELWREAARFPAPLASSIGLLVLVSATHVAQAVAIALAMSAVLSGQGGDVLVALASIAGIALARLVLSLAQTAAAARLGGHVRQALRRRAMRAALVPARLHDTDTRDGSVRAALSDGIDGTDAYVSKYLPAVAQVALTCPLVVVALLVLSPWAGVCVGLGVVLALAGPVAWNRVSARRGVQHWDSYESLSADLLESLRGMATLRALGDVPGTRQRLHARSEALRRATERVMRASLAGTGITDFGVQAGVVAATLTALAHAATGVSPTLEVYAILLLASEAFRPVRDLSRHWHAGFLGLTAIPGLAALAAFTDPTPTTEDRRTERPAAAPDATELRVSGLTFRYPGMGRPVLDRLDLTARRGALSAVVGPSGAGKSTLFDLLLGFLKPEAGRIELDGRPVRDGDIAVVSQRPVLFAGTIRDNLAVTGTPAESELEDACRAAGIMAEIETFPHGLDTEVAEAGSSLSGGQRQRLALARALLARRPVLLVDEPTSALDTDRAADVTRTLHRVARDRIVIMISHRPETLADVAELVSLAAPPLDRSTP
ncbi:hypothetical protein B1813_02555 [Saccharomonospora piscinae]|uniref:Fused ATPase/permease component of ABC-type transporter involved in cytochrome bd biogenesis n=1 Tax=Saccharomonospora piscinae TaxID=687388 RepID=A0A1V9ACW6_SACPI|nr:ATP-binding cassette domain-containing protein [Saccharomonospora piscinae]OQO94965.1 hypothetical protein B1813_02555 [Saccharomonospora piscinae]